MITVFIIIGITCLISFAAWKNEELFRNTLFYPYGMNRDKKQMYRFVTSGFIHADQQHLLFNMITLFFFGTNLVRQFGVPIFIIFYVTAIVCSSLVTYFKNIDNYNYSALGASGAISAVMYASILFNPWMMINGIIPGFVYAIGYVIYSVYMNKQKSDNIGHETHLYGALYGWIFTALIVPGIFPHFINSIMSKFG
jgi:membrane associated rhomboid family serine protease